MSAACLSWATICIAPCDCCFGWIRFGYWAGRGEGSDDCNVLNHVLKLCGASQACLRFEIRFFVWREVVQAVFCHRCHCSCQTLKDRGAWTLLDSNSRCPHSAAYHNIARWGEGSNVSIGQQSGWNVIHDRCSSAFNVFVFGFENGQATAPKMGVEICHRTGAIGRGLPSTQQISIQSSTNICTFAFLREEFAHGQHSFFGVSPSQVAKRCQKHTRLCPASQAASAVTHWESWNADWIGGHWGSGQMPSWAKWKGQEEGHAKLNLKDLKDRKIQK